MAVKLGITDTHTGNSRKPSERTKNLTDAEVLFIYAYMHIYINKCIGVHIYTNSILCVGVRYWGIHV